MCYISFCFGVFPLISSSEILMITDVGKVLIHMCNTIASIPIICSVLKSFLQNEQIVLS